jgi:diguanylate cyclase (GGDEF)-like protein
MVKTTLRARLTILLVFASILMICVFTFIQINNQIRNIQEFNLFRAKQSAVMARGRLAEMFSDLSGTAGRSVSEKAVKEFAKEIASAGIVQTVIVFDGMGDPVALEGDLSLAFDVDKGFVKQIAASRDKSEWLTPVINRQHKLINLFVVVDNPYGFVFKFVFSLGNIQEALNNVYGPVFLIMLVVLAVNILLAAALSRALIDPVTVLNKTSKEVALGNLDTKIIINTQDELQELSETFNYMIKEVKKMKAYAENANPLTKLPGNIIVREAAESRIKANKKFVLIYSDLDNFKAFNDKYGVNTGDEAIVLTANIMLEVIGGEKNEEDFVGHEGGDDFILLTTPERASAVAEKIIKEFDSRIRFLYTQEDLKRGYIEAHARDTGEIRKFPIMTISLCGVGNYNRKISSYSQLTNIAAELKKLAKKKEGSCFVMNKRVRDPGEGPEHRGDPDQ